MLKTKTFLLMTKPPASTQNSKNLTILQKTSVTPDKNGKSARMQLAPPVHRQAYGMQ